MCPNNRANCKTNNQETDAMGIGDTLCEDHFPFLPFWHSSFRDFHQEFDTKDYMGFCY
jgi:hypothetical protein